MIAVGVDGYSPRAHGALRSAPDGVAARQPAPACMASC